MNEASMSAMQEQERPREAAHPPQRREAAKRITINTQRSPLKRAVADLWGGLLAARIWGMLALADIRNQHRRSKLGALWITVGMAVFISMLGVLYGQLFGRDLAVYIPHLTVGYIVWRLIAGLLDQGCRTFTAAEGVIKQLSAPLSVHAFRVVFRGALTLIHHSVVFVAVALIFQIPVTPQWALALAGLALILLTGLWVAILLGTICARFRDIPQIVASATHVLFFITPVIWMPDLMPKRAILLWANPFYHYIEVVRAPLLNLPIDPLHWQAVGSMTLLGWIVTLGAYARFRPRIAYWL